MGTRHLADLGRREFGSESKIKAKEAALFQ